MVDRAGSTLLTLIRCLVTRICPGMKGSRTGGGCSMCGSAGPASSRISTGPRSRDRRVILVAQGQVWLRRRVAVLAQTSIR